MESKFGVVVLLDALGASDYSNEQIREFLTARERINSVITKLCSPESVKTLGEFPPPPPPEIFTFGDTVIIAIELSKEAPLREHLFIISTLIRRYLFIALNNKIMFRGCFSIGDYIADDKSNTVMGQAISDAASWYEQSNWMGVCSTPKSKIVLESLVTKASGTAALKKLRSADYGYFLPYSVPMKNDKHINLYAVNWASELWSKENLTRFGETCGETYFLKLLSNFNIPKGTEEKYKNTQLFFEHVFNNKTLH